MMKKCDLKNEAAARVAQTYKYVDSADVDTGYVTASQVAELERYAELIYQSR